MLRSSPPAAIPAIVGQHAEEAATLWQSRARAVRAPEFRLADLLRLDLRVEAHLDGLRLAGPEGWETAVEQLATPLDGDVFVASLLAIESRETAKLVRVADLFAENRKARGMVSALGWAGWQVAQPVVRWFLDSAEPQLRRIGIAASAVARVFPGDYLPRAIFDEDAAIRARALRAVGELGRREMAAALQPAFADTDAACRYAAAVSAALLGDGTALTVLQDVVETDEAHAVPACRVLMRALGQQGANAVLRGWAAGGSSERRLVESAGVIGDPRYVPWLIEHMANPGLARLAGEAFTSITGLDLAATHLDAPPPEGVEGGPNDDPADENVALDEDAGLPWPSAEKIAGWWQQRGGAFENGRRYFAGVPIAPDALKAVLKTGRQRQRQAAAIELMLLQKTAFLFETRARGDQQKALLGL